MPEAKLPDLRVTCALIHHRGRVLCTQRSETMPLPLKWEFPGGKLEPGEDAVSCIVREIAEELDLQIRVREKAPSVRHPYKAGRMLELIPFVAEKTGGTLHLREHADARWCEVHELHQLDWAEADVGIVDWWIKNRDRFQ
jgi:8-oxo-dGTP diphosphatase